MLLKSGTIFCFAVFATIGLFAVAISRSQLLSAVLSEFRGVPLT